VERIAELGHDLAAPRLEVLLQDGPRRLAQVMGAGVLVGAGQASDDEPGSG
jgi:hypothetical protein